eukprot:a341005_73.p1 GENE.a341005_73~~a341005_73.p1  ORF type:complete len:441 (+),score=157.83 a341005_73:34-1323(+)
MPEVLLRVVVPQNKRLTAVEVALALTTPAALAAASAASGGASEFEAPGRLVTRESLGRESDLADRPLLGASSPGANAAAGAAAAPASQPPNYREDVCAILHSHNLEASWETAEFLELDGGISLFWEANLMVHSAHVHDLVVQLEHAGVGTKVGEICVLPIGLNGRIQVKPAEGAEAIDKARRAKIVTDFLQRSKKTVNTGPDYLMTVVIASWLAATGLASGWVANEIASVLASPLMGPSIQGAIAVLISDGTMAWQALYKFWIGCALCFATGFMLTFLYAHWAMSDLHWPTPGMASRGTLTSVAMAINTGIPAGVLVAWGNTSGSLIMGAAIAAALLPPIVIAGMDLSFAMFGEVFTDEHVHHEKFFIQSAYSMSTGIFTIIIVFFTAMTMLFFKKISHTVQPQDVANIRAMYMKTREHLTDGSRVRAP